jgi:hypothetical protein
MAKILRIRCPLCGMLPEKEKLEGEANYKLQVFLQELGGRIPRSQLENWKTSKGRVRRGTAGIMSYTDVTEDQLADAIPILEERLKYAAKLLGYRVEKRKK